MNRNVLHCIVEEKRIIDSKRVFDYLKERKARKHHRKKKSMEKNFKKLLKNSNLIIFVSILEQIYVKI